MEERKRLAILSLVERALVDCVRNGTIDELGEQHTVTDLLRELNTCRIHRQQVPQLRISTENVVNVLGKSRHLFL